MSFFNWWTNGHFSKDHGCCKQQQRWDAFFCMVMEEQKKTFMWKNLSTALHAQHNIVLNVASSGIASLLSLGSWTAYSRFKTLVLTLDNYVCNIHQGSELSTLLKMTRLIIWDKAPMAHKFCFETLDKSLRDIMKTNGNEQKIFRGKVVLFGGDFR